MEGLSSQRRSSGSFSDDDDQQSNHSAASTTPSTVNNDDVYTALDYAALLNATPASIPLFRGNAVFDIPVPPALLANASSLSSSSPNNDESHLGERTEFSHVRYSALTCKPTGFVRAGYTLRPELYARPRPTGILVSMIVRGEGVDVVRRSLDSVRNAVKLLGSRREKPWGQGAWKKVVLVLACDGEQRPETMALFAAQGLWTDRLLVSRVRGKQVLGHLFEYTTRLHVSRDREQRALRIGRSSIPLQTLLCVFNQVGTVEAQQWIIAGFGELLAPRVWIPVKVGDAPSPEFLYDAWAAESEIDRGRYYHSYDGGDNQGADAEVQWPERGPADFEVEEEQTADERYSEYLTTLDTYMRSYHAPAAGSSNSSGSGSRGGVRGQARNFFKSLMNH